MRKTMWMIMMTIALSGISAAHKRLIALEGRWQFSAEDERAAAYIQDAPNHLTLTCHTGDPGKPILSEPYGIITVTVSLLGCQEAIGKLLDWCQSHTGK